MPCHCFSSLHLSYTIMPISRYNMCPRLSRSSPYSARRASRQVHKPPAVTKSKTVTAPAPSRSTADDSTRRLYEKPERWTQDHFRITNLQLESDLPFVKIVNVEYIPLDEDIGKFALYEKSQRNSTQSDVVILRILTVSGAVSGSLCGRYRSSFNPS